MENETSATTVAIINKTKFSSAPIRLPPAIKEQMRIVDKLGSVLAKVEVALACLDKIPTFLKRFRQSVLAAATSDELAKYWREGNSFVSSYLGNIDWSVLDGEVAPYSIPSNWTWQQVENELEQSQCETAAISGMQSRKLI